MFSIGEKRWFSAWGCCEVGLVLFFKNLAFGSGKVGLVLSILDVTELMAPYG